MYDIISVGIHILKKKYFLKVNKERVQSQSVISDMYGIRKVSI